MEHRRRIRSSLWSNCNIIHVNQILSYLALIDFKEVYDYIKREIHMKEDNSEEISARNKDNQTAELR